MDYASHEECSGRVHLFDMTHAFIVKASIGKFAIVHTRNPYFAKDISDIPKEDKIFFRMKYAPYYLWLKTNKIYRIQLDDGSSYSEEMDAWFCKIIDADMIATFIHSDISPPKEEGGEMEVVRAVYGRCEASMHFFDSLYRDYIQKHKFKRGEIIAIKSVAGSGKTTTLLRLAKLHASKRILYIAFNKSLIEEIREKIKVEKCANMIPKTFDALVREIYIVKNGLDNYQSTVIDLRANVLGEYDAWFAGRKYAERDFYVKQYMQFCNQSDYNDIDEYAMENLGEIYPKLRELWNLSAKHELITFASIRKLVQIHRSSIGYIDNNYDMIFIDESQDFDAMMLKILLEDTTIPKLFVGDPNQAIYQWKGSINAFERLPPLETISLEFYSTFRVGNPACDIIRSRFAKCYMISKSMNYTEFRKEIPEKYTYLFRNWRNLLQTAQKTRNVWIHNYKNQIELMKRLHERLKYQKYKGGGDEEDMGHSDDLPAFLKRLSSWDLKKMIDDISRNIVEKKEDADVEMFTIHSYKGLENDVIRIFNDIDIEKEGNLYYVALTRAKKTIIENPRDSSIRNYFFTGRGREDD